MYLAHNCILSDWYTGGVEKYLPNKYKKGYGEEIHKPLLHNDQNGNEYLQKGGENNVTEDQLDSSSLTA